MDIFKVKDEIFGNMLRRRFSEEILYPSGVGYTNILNGAFLENGTIEFIRILDRANKKVNIYGTGNEKWQWTTLEDTARYTVEAIHDESALNQVVKVCGDEISLNEFAKVLSEVTGSTWSTNILGTEEDLRNLIAKNYKEQPQNIYAWMPLQYVWGSVSEKFILRPLWNNKYPSVHPTTVRAWAASQKW